jgi:hypothetical protein
MVSNRPLGIYRWNQIRAACFRVTGASQIVSADPIWFCIRGFRLCRRAINAQSCITLRLSEPELSLGNLSR